MSDEAHVVGIDASEGCKAITHDGEEGDEDIVDNVDDVVFSTAKTDPA